MVDDLEGRLCQSKCTSRQDWLISVDRMPRPREPASPFRYFNSSPEVIRLGVMMYVRFPLSLRNVEDLLFERGIDLCHETVRMWRSRVRWTDPGFGPEQSGGDRSEAKGNLTLSARNLPSFHCAGWQSPAA